MAQITRRLQEELKSCIAPLGAKWSALAKTTLTRQEALDFFIEPRDHEVVERASQILSVDRTTAICNVHVGRMSLKGMFGGEYDDMIAEMEEEWGSPGPSLRFQLSVCSLDIHSNAGGAALGALVSGLR